MNVEPVTLEGNFVRLEPLGVHHAKGLLAAAYDPVIWKYLTVPQPKTIPEIENWIQSALDSKDHLPFATIRKEDAKIVGSTRFLEIKPLDKTLEIGWTWIATEAQRTPVNTEAKYLMLCHAFDILSAERVQLKTDAKNERSRKAIERIGAQFEGVLRSYQRYWHGAMRDTAMYAITVSDWPGVKIELEQRMRPRAATRA